MVNTHTMKRKTKTTKKTAARSARDVVTLHSVFTDIANAIRTKGETSDPISPVSMGNAIRSLKDISAASLPASNLPAIFQDIANAIRACGATGTMTVSQMAGKVGDIVLPQPTRVTYT